MLVIRMIRQVISSYRLLLGIELISILILDYSSGVIDICLGFDILFWENTL